MKYGYPRVSSDTQDYQAQVEALKAAGCERIFSEKASGKSTNGRPEISKLMKALLPGDAVVVTKLDRLARSSRDLHNILGELKDRGCGFVSLGDSWCDTTTDVGRLVLAIMSGIAEFERELIRKRCQAGIDRAKRKGTKFGRPAVFWTPARGSALPSATAPARPWLSWRASTTAANRRSGGCCKALSTQAPLQCEVKAPALIPLWPWIWLPGPPLVCRSQQQRCDPPHTWRK